MLIKRFYDTRLAQASYLVGCQATGDALIIDPARDIQQYLDAVKAEGMRLIFVTETHIHADFLSGTRELVAASGALAILSDEGGAGWRYGWGHEPGVRLVCDGETFMVGNVKVDVLHTPGHTPEHISFRITDTKATDKPMGVFTGDFVFVGDVGRPDLLERAAGVRGTMDAAARQLYASIQKFKQHPDYLQIWPGHGAGSACGKSLGAVPSSTLGYERIANWAFNVKTEHEFVLRVLDGQPEPPAYFAIMKQLNRDGPPKRAAGRPTRVGADALRRILAEGGVVADTRKTAEFALGHLHGAFNVPLGGSFPTYAGTVLPYTKPIHLVVAEESLDDALASLASVGLDDVAAWATPADVTGDLETTPQASPADALARAARGEVTIVDVRRQSEWDEGHIAGAIHLPLSEIGKGEGLDRIPRGKPVVLHCESGGRSSIAASVLLAAGRGDVINMQGGISAWKKAGLPIEHLEVTPF